jgi:hypothetical protein
MESFFSGVENLSEFINAHTSCRPYVVETTATFFSHNITKTGFRAIAILLIIPLAGWLRKIHQKYVRYTKNKSISRNKTNLTCYDNMNFTEVDLTIFHVFKKCDYEVNKCYWDINCDSKFVYTNFDPRDEFKTLDKVMKITKLRQLRTKLVDDYFECCLYSYITNENRTQMDHLLSSNGLDLGEINVKSQSSFEKNIMNNNLNGLTPDIHITHNSKSTIIDAYNGTDKTTIIRKLKKYLRVCNDVYVFASEIAVSEQFVLKENIKHFKLFRLNEENLEEMQQISIGALTIKISDLNTIYHHHYSVFYSEVHYWLHCDALRQILKNT